MKRIRYDQETKAAILSTVLEARKGGKSWVDALEVAKQAGYKGTEGGLVQFVKMNTTPKKAAAAASEEAPKKKRGRKPKIKSAPAALAAPVAKSSADPLDISAMVHKAVTDAVANALESLVAKLKSGK